MLYTQLIILKFVNTNSLIHVSYDQATEIGGVGGIFYMPWMKFFFENTPPWKIGKYSASYVKLTGFSLN